MTEIFIAVLLGRISGHLSPIFGRSDHPEIVFFFVVSVGFLFGIPLVRGFRQAIVIDILFFTSLIAQIARDRSFEPTTELVQPGGKLVVHGTIAERPRKSTKGQELILRVAEIADQEIEPFNLRVIVYDCATDLRYGQDIIADLRILATKQRCDGADKNCLYAVVNNSGDILAYERFPHANRETSYRSSLDKSIAGLDSTGLLSALLLGDKSRLSDRALTSFKTAGLSHLIVVSGLHLGLIFFFVVLFFDRILRFFPIVGYFVHQPHLVRILACISVVFYFHLLTYSPATHRALIVVILFTFLLIIGRKTNPLTLVSIGLILQLAEIKQELFDYSLILSYWAFIAIIIFNLTSRLNNTLISTKNRFWKVLLQYSLFTLAMQLFLMPINLHLFDGMNLYSMVNNLIVVPSFSFLIMPALLVIYLVQLLIPWYLGSLLPIFDTAMNILVSIVEYLPDLPLKFHLGILPLLGVITAATLSILPLIGYWPKNCWRIFFVIVVDLGTVVLALWPFDKQNDQGSITFLDVGHGDSIVIEDPIAGISILDSGGKRLGADPGQYIVGPWLFERRVKALRRVILSHADFDHIGGAFHIFETFSIAELCLPASIRRDRNINDLIERALAKGTIIRYVDDVFPLYFARNAPKDDDLLSMTIHNPVRGRRYRTSNEGSLVTRISLNGQSLLLTGDVERLALRQLLSNDNRPLEATILQLPHHGSKQIDRSSLHNRVRPLLSVVSNNTCSKELSDRFTTLSTACNGNISIVFDKNSLSITTEIR